MKEGALAIGFWSQPSSTFSKLPVLTINLTKNSLICGLYPRVPDETPYLDDPIDLEKAISSAVSLSVKRRLQILRKEFAGYDTSLDKGLILYMWGMPVVTFDISYFTGLPSARIFSPSAIEITWPMPIMDLWKLVFS